MILNRMLNDDGHLIEIVIIVDVLINCLAAPASFEPLLNAARAILSDYTNNALYIYGKNRREWSSFLDKNFDWKELPSSIGGTKVLPGAEDYALEANE
jgi:hypothetical protein